MWKRGLKEKIEIPYYSFPKGKLEPGETEDSCAIREVEEETGFNIVGHYDPELFFEEKVLLTYLCACLHLVLMVF